MTVVANGITDSWDSMKNAAGDMRKGLQDVGNRLTTGFNDAVQVAGRGMKMAADWTIQAAQVGWVVRVVSTNVCGPTDCTLCWQTAGLVMGARRSIEKRFVY